MDEHLTRTSDAPLSQDRRAATVSLPYLYLALECDRPDSPGVRFCLADTSRIEVGRGGERSWVRHPTGLRINLPDRFMSQRHAEIVHVDGGWLVRDLGSKNGSFVDGAPITETPLEDGDLVEFGHTFFVFRVEPGTVGGPSVKVAGRGEPLALPTLIPALENNLASLAKLARTNAPLVILGETGTGKEVLARAVHQASGRTGAFVGVNCGALPANLVESELFGSKKGSFSGATEDRVGLVRASDGGTLLLDEIGDLPLSSQTALLRTLQEGEVRAVGASKAVPVDLRVLSATHHDLATLVKKGRFRADLLARLSGYTVRLPSLRERRGDFGHLLATLAARSQPNRPFALTPEAARALLRHVWPMNVRELEQTVRTAFVLAGHGPGPVTIELEHLPDAVKAAPPRAPHSTVPRSRRKDPAEFDARREAFIATMKEHRGNVSAVARAMGTARMQIHRWIRQFDVDPDDYRAS